MDQDNRCTCVRAIFLRSVCASDDRRSGKLRHEDPSNRPGRKARLPLGRESVRGDHRATSPLQKRGPLHSLLLLQYSSHTCFPPSIGALQNSAMPKTLRVFANQRACRHTTGSPLPTAVVDRVTGDAVLFLDGRLPRVFRASVSRRHCACPTRACEPHKR